MKRQKIRTPIENKSKNSKVFFGAIESCKIITNKWYNPNVGKVDNSAKTNTFIQSYFKNINESDVFWS